MSNVHGRDAAASAHCSIEFEKRDALRVQRHASEDQRKDFERSLQRALEDAPVEPDSDIAVDADAAPVAPEAQAQARAELVEARAAACFPPLKNLALTPAAAAASTCPPCVRSELAHAPSLPDIAPPSAEGQWRFELADGSLPVRSVELNRDRGGTLALALTLGADARPMHDASLDRLRQRLAARGSKVDVVQTHSPTTDDPLDGTRR